MNGSETRDEKLTILMPVYNDWEALWLLLPRLDRELKAGGLAVGIVLVDDASTTAPPKNFAALFEAIATIDVLSLRRNLGHQRAIAVGLSYIEANHPQSRRRRYGLGWAGRPQRCSPADSGVRRPSWRENCLRHSYQTIGGLDIHFLLSPVPPYPLSSDRHSRSRRQLQCRPTPRAEAIGGRIGVMEPLRRGRA